MMIFQYNEKILQELFEMSFIKKVILVLSEMSLLIYFIKVWRKQCANGYSFKRYCLEKIIVIPIGISIFSIILISHVNCKISNNEPLCKPAVQYLLNHTSKEKVILWSNYDDGGYAEYYGLCTYIDPRAEIFLKSNNRKQDVLLEYKALQTGKLYYKEFVERYSFTHFLTYKQDLLFTYLAYDDDFKMIYQDNNYRLYEKVIY